MIKNALNIFYKYRIRFNQNKTWAVGFTLLEDVYMGNIVNTIYLLRIHTNKVLSRQWTCCTL